MKSMSSKAITEKREPMLSPPRWHVAREVAPSVMEADQPIIPRVIGAIGLLFVTVGAVPLAARLGASKPFLGTLAEILPGWVAILMVVLGLGGLLYHAASDGDFQVRRAYMAKGFAWLILGLALSFWPVAGSEGVAVWGARFVPFGVVCLMLGLLFLLAFVRNETELSVRDMATYVIGGLGGAMALGGFLFGTLYNDFLVPKGIVLILLGLAFVWAFVGMRGSADNLGYLAALGMGGVGLLALLVAFIRSVIVPLFVAWGWMEPREGYAIPFGLLLMAGGLMYAAVAVGIVSDNTLVVLTRRELAAIFFSPIAYTVLIGFQLIGWGLFVSWVLQTLTVVDPGRREILAPEVSEPIVKSYFWNWFPVICAMFVVPVVTMRALSEEKRTGTLEMLLTAPLNETAVVVSKFIAIFLFFMVLWAPLGLYLIALRAEADRAFDYLPVLAYYIALAASGAGFVAMGIFFSSLTKNQIAAAIMSFVGMMVLTLLFWVVQIFKLGPSLDAAIRHMSYVELWRVAIEGKLTTWDLMFHISAAIFWLFLTVKILDSRRWR
jgi:ABC-type transport system involved in multi-copper enzyme maturation permease subunit